MIQTIMFIILLRLFLFKDDLRISHRYFGNLTNVITVVNIPLLFYTSLHMNSVNAWDLFRSSSQRKNKKRIKRTDSENADNSQTSNIVSRNNIGSSVQFDTSHDSKNDEISSIAPKVVVNAPAVTVPTPSNLSSTKQSRIKKIDKSTGNIRFSGFYEPERKTVLEHHTGSFLTTKAAFLDETYINTLKVSTVPEEVASLLTDRKKVLMTRDFFDFQSIYLSSTVDYMPRMGDESLHSQLVTRMNQTIVSFGRNSYGGKGQKLMTYRMSENRPRMLKTIVIIPFYLKVLKIANQSIMKTKSILQLLNFEATVLSVSRYFPRIVVFTGNDEDLATLKSMDLPVWRYVSVADRINGDMRVLPRESVLYVKDRLANRDLITTDDLEWNKIQNVFYTEMNQLLYTRSLLHTFNILEGLGKDVVIVPHRMHTVALPKSFDGVRQVWSKGVNAWPTAKLNALDSVDLIVEDVWMPTGSCCDDGRFAFADCGNFWFNCQKYGIQNYTTWLRFGQQGYTLFTGTTHAAKCSYYSQRITCPLPESCSIEKSMPVNINQICQEIPNVVQVT